jgi:hypothetical protein
VAAGLVVSVAGNVGHVTSGSVADRATWAVPPVAAAAALAVGLGVLKRVVEHHPQATAKPTPRPAATSRPKATGRGIEAATGAARQAALVGRPVPSARSMARDHHIGRDKATQVRAAVLAEFDGHPAS